MVVQNTCNKDIPEHDNDEVVDNHDNHSDAGDRVAAGENATHSEVSDEEPEENDLIRYVVGCNATTTINHDLEFSNFYP